MFWKSYFFAKWDKKNMIMLYKSSANFCIPLVASKI